MPFISITCNQIYRHYTITKNNNKINQKGVYIVTLKASCKVAALRETIASIRRKSDWMMQKVNFNNYLP